MSWITLSLGAAFLWAITNIFDKYIIGKLIDKPIVPVIVMGVLGALASVVIFLVGPIGPLSITHILLAFLAGICYVILNFLYFKAIQLEEVSKVVPLFYLAPLFTLVLAGMFLGEIFTPTTYLGIVLLVVGAIVVAARRPFSFSLGRAFWYMVLSALFIALSYTLTKYLLGFADFWTIFAYKRLGAFLALIPWIVLNLKTFQTIFARQGFTPFGLVTVSESINLAGNLAATAAIAVGFVTLVNALQSVQPFFVLLFTILISLYYPRILREEIGRSTVFVKLAAIAMMFVGVLLIG